MTRPIALVALMLLASSVRTPAATWNVFEDGSGDAPTIQAAVDSSAAGDSILVHPGTYSEQVLVNESVTLASVGGPEATTVDAGGGEYCLHVTVATLIEGLRFVGAQPSYTSLGAAVRAYADLTVRGCVFENTHRAICCGADLHITDTVFKSGVWFLSGSSLTVTESVFAEINWSTWWDTSPLQIGWGSSYGNVSVSRCEFVDCGAPFVRATPMIGFDSPRNEGLTLDVVDNLFTRNGGPAVGRWDLEIPQSPTSGLATVVLRNNTVARNLGNALGHEDLPLRVNLTLENNVFSANGSGIHLPDNGAGATLLCNDSWGHDDENWVGFPNPEGIDGNFSLSPKFCDGVGGDFTAASNSPLLPQNNDCNVLIGTFGHGCGPVSIENSSWGGIKASYR